MSSSLLITKLYFPPSRSKLVSRPRLISRLSVGLRGPLTLIAAPAGYGKTTLLSEWRGQMGNDLSVAWLSLDANDNDLLRFLLYLTAAINTIQPGLAKDTSLLLQAAQLPPVDAIATTLINELTNFSDDLILILDDYHVITNPEIHPFLVFLLDHLPPHLHLAILTRSDPPFHLARFRARRQMVEIRAADLRFASDEAATFLNKIMGLNLTETEVAALETRTEGWIAGLQLAALSMQDRNDIANFISAFSGSHHYIVDYLAEEVLNRQPANIRDFLLKTSILERLTGSLCEAITGQQDGQATLEMLVSLNLFLIPLDDERRWFRYHHLFADLLRNRLEALGQDQIIHLHSLASNWFDQHEMVVEAIEHAFAAQDYDDVRRLMREYFPVWWGYENWGRVTQWFNLFPSAFLHAEPWLCVVQAWMVWRDGKLEETELLLDCSQHAIKTLKSLGKFPKDDLEYLALEAEILAFRALITTQKNDPQKVIALANRALELAPDKAYTVQAIAYSALQVIHRDLGEMDKTIELCQLGLPMAILGGQVGTIVSAYNLLGVTLTIQGQLRRAKEVYKDALAYAEKMGHTNIPAFSLIRMRLADLHYQWNQLDSAEELAREGLIQADFLRNYWTMIYGRYLLCMIHLSRGEKQEAFRLWDEIESILPKITGAYYLEEIKRILILIKLRLGIEDHQPFSLIGLENHPNSTQLETLIRQVHFLIATNIDNNAQPLLMKLWDIVEQRGHKYWMIEILILQAICSIKQGEQIAANRYIEKAICYAEPEGFMRFFLDEGETVWELLKGISSKLQDNSVIAYVRRILLAFGETTSTKQFAKQSLIAPLSERELEVMALIAAGYSNKEIADELVIAIGTVKRHTVNIFNKLDVKNRTEAVAKARELGLL